MKSRFLLIPILFLIILSACNKQKAGPAPNARDESQPVVVEELSLRSLDEYIRVSGKLEGITDISMSSEASGRILTLYKKLGDSVSKGERIGMIDNEILKISLDQAEAAKLAAQSSLENAERNQNYALASKAKNLISDTEYNNFLTAYKAAKASFDGAKAAHERALQAYQNSYLVAPEAGTISNLFVKTGQVISIGTPIANITDASTLILKTGVGESQISKLKKGQSVELTRSGNSRTYKGVIRGFGNRPLSGTASYPVEISILNKADLLPGMVVSARILTEQYKDLLYTPITNILKEYDKNYLFVITDDNIAEKREITLGRTIAENVEITSGAATGDRIVTTGIENLEDGSKVNIRQ
ncbi:MAG: efflux RND transporter periplasmic adaptor subunit [Candidatus Cloacimonetes bacterium]|nr:efflux RND transporter periplasmic adaptor subunit [Candidatus Cloacimonadota bacterium]